MTLNMEILIFIFPLISFFIFQFFKLKIKNVILYCFNILLLITCLILTTYMFSSLLNVNNASPIILYPFIKSDYFFIDWTLRFDLLVTGLMMVSIFIVLITVIFSISFYKSHIINCKIQSATSLSLFSFFILVSSNNLIQFFAGWHLIILSSYFLSNIFNKKNNTYNNGNVFLYNRISDLVFFLSLFFIYAYTKSIQFDFIFNNFEILNSSYLSLFIKDIRVSEIIFFSLFLSFLLRCRQFFVTNSSYDFSNLGIPSLILIIYVIFLPTGLYFVLRFVPITHFLTESSNLNILLGFSLTSIFLFLLLKSKNIKDFVIYNASCLFSVLLFSIGVKSYNLALFHFLTSTLSLVLLCMGFGIIVSNLNSEYSIRNMGGLFFKAPSTFLFTLIGSLSLIGIPYFSGFYSNKLLFLSSHFINESIYLLSLIICYMYTFVISYVLFKYIFSIFFSQNNCNIHLYNKVNEDFFLKKLILFLLSIIIIFLGWILKNLFIGLNAEYLWELVLVGNANFSINHEDIFYEKNQEIKDILCYFGMALAMFNYTIFLKLGNNMRLKNNKLYKSYLKFIYTDKN